MSETCTDDRTGERPRIALTAGDPAGIGPEIVAAVLADAQLAREVQLVAVGPAASRPEGIPHADDARCRGGDARDRSGTHVWIDCGGDPDTWRVGHAGAASGRAALAALRTGHELAWDGRVDALVTAPVSKQALHLAGERVEGQTELLARWCGVERYEMLAVAGPLRVMLLSRHMPLRAALDCVDEQRVLDRLTLLAQALERLGMPAPRLALAGLNPHAGENGLLGDEEGRILRPAAMRARDLGLRVDGPLSADSVFVRAAQGEFDGVLALYHDQAFIPIKLLARDEGVTVVAGLPYLRVSPTHGTAFDIAGTGRASAKNLLAAVRRAAAWAAAGPAR